MLLIIVKKVIGKFSKTTGQFFHFLSVDKFSVVQFSKKFQFSLKTIWFHLSLKSSFKPGDSFNNQFLSTIVHKIFKCFDSAYDDGGTFFYLLKAFDKV